VGRLKHDIIVPLKSGAGLTVKGYPLSPPYT